MKELVFQVWKSCFHSQWLSCTPFTQGHFWCHHCIPCLWKCGFWYTICHTLDILDQVTCVIVLMAAILDAILNLTPFARDPDCPPKFFYLPRGALPGSRVKMRGHLIAHRIPLGPRTIVIECNDGTGNHFELWVCNDYLPKLCTYLYLCIIDINLFDF